MNKYIFILFFILLNTSINSQTILERLDSPDYSVRLKALIEIRDNMLIEYATALEDRIWSQPNLLLTFYSLETLFTLDYGKDIEYYIFEFIDFCDGFPQEQPLYFKVKATELLVKLNNLTTIDYVFEYMNIDPLKNSEKFIVLLKDIALNVPTYSQAIKDLFLNIKDNSTSYILRQKALEYLILIFGENNLKDELLASIINDPNSNVRKYAMEYYNFPDKKDVLMQQIQNDNNWYRRIKYIEDFLKDFTKPEDLKFIKDYLVIEPDTKAQTNIENQIYLFTPPKYGNMNYLDWAIDLSGNLDNLYEYLWIGGPEYTYYKETLGDLFVLFEEKDTSASCEALNKIKENAISDVDNERISWEAYSYIFYKASYIQETLLWRCN